jgi:hypothetical protein
VYVNRHLDQRTDRLAHQRPDGQIGYVVIVHHVKVDQVGAGGNHGLHFFAKAGKIGRQDAGRKAMGHG